MEKKQYPGRSHVCYKITDPKEIVGSGPLVAIILDTYDGEYALNRNIVDTFVKKGLSAAFVTHRRAEKQLAKLKPKGIFLPGGSFPIPPETIADPYKKKKASLGQFDAYMAGLNYAFNNKLPTFGVCAGEQMMGVWLGGKMTGGINDIPKPIHRNNKAAKKDAVHKIDIVKTSLLHKIAGIGSYDVVSKHNAKITEDFSGNFNITARAHDGTIEAIEPKKPWSDFVLGVQWHPEDPAVKKPNGADAKLFDAFARAVKKA